MTAPFSPFTTTDRHLADTFAVVLADTTAHPILEHLNADDYFTAEDRYELAAILAVAARGTLTPPGD